MRIGCFPYRPGTNPYQRLFANSLEDAGASVVRIPPRKLLPLHWALSHQIDLLHLDWPHDFYKGRNWPLTQLKRAMYFLGCRKLRNFPLVWTAHNLAAHDAKSAMVEQRMLQKLVDCCDGIVAMSEAAAAALRDTYRIPPATRIAVIPHGHYIDAYSNTISQVAARKRLGIPGSAKVILFFGRVHPYKGVEELLDAFAKVNEPDALLVIAGQPKSTEIGKQLQRMAQSGGYAERVRFALHTIPEAEVQVYFNACDVVALPFREILNSGTLMLALSFGRCVVAPRQGSIPEITPEGALFGYDRDDKSEFHSALANALSDDDLSRRGVRAQRQVRGRFSWESIGTSMMALYSSTLGTS